MILGQKVNYDVLGQYKNKLYLSNVKQNFTWTKVKGTLRYTWAMVNKTRAMVNKTILGQR